MTTLYIITKGVIYECCLSLRVFETSIAFSAPALTPVPELCISDLTWSPGFMPVAHRLLLKFKRSYAMSSSTKVSVMKSPNNQNRMTECMHVACTSIYYLYVL